MHFFEVVYLFSTKNTILLNHNISTFTTSIFIHIKEVKEAELNEPVSKEYLQTALNITLKRFPFFRSILKKGIFWYYFEESRLIPEVHEEDRPPCSPIYDPNNKGLLFEVTYYRNRINLEVFHALSDGTGVIQFLKALIVNYVNQKYRSKDTLIKYDDYDASESQMTLDGFSKYFSKVKVKRINSPTAFRFKGRKYPNYQISVVECVIPLSAIKAEAKSNDMSITALLVSLFIESIGENMAVRDKKKPVSVSIPVNLRNYFPSKTSQNFFSVMNLLHDFAEQGDTPEDVSINVKSFFEENLKKEKLFINFVTLFLFASSTLCVMLYITFTKDVLWSPFVVAGAACLWVSLLLALKSRRHLPRAIFWEVLLIAVLATLWDASTGFYAWSISFVIPILFSGAIVMTRILASILKMAINDYIVYLIINGILGIIPLIFILTGMVTVVIPSMICVSISLISLAILFIFDRHDLIEEVQRRAHI